MNLKKFFIAILLASALLAPLASSAAILDTSLIAEAQNCGAQGSACSLNTFVKLGVNVANFILGIVGALTLLMFVYGGVTWIISGGSADKVKKGKDIIIGSVVGLMIVFGSYLIINFVVNDILGAQGDYKFTGSIKNETTTQNKVGALCESILSGYCISGAGICASDEQSIGESDCGKSNV